jgi:hypothetical protein
LALPEIGIRVDGEPGRPGIKKDVQRGSMFNEFAE